MTRKQASVILVVVLAALAHPRAQNNPQATSGSWRPTIVAQHGMVAAGHPLAAEAGMRILKAGGNAIDAAIATWAVQGEVEAGVARGRARTFLLFLPGENRKGDLLKRHRDPAPGASHVFSKQKGGGAAP